MTRITSAIVFSAWALFMALTASAAFAAWDVDSMNIQIDQTSVVVNEGCSGTLIDLDERVVLTAAHCVKAQFEQVTVEDIADDGTITRREVRRQVPGFVKQLLFVDSVEVRQVQYRTKLLAVDKRRDLALVQIISPIPNLMASEIACESPRRGEGVYIVGNPGGWLYASVVKGIVSSVERTYGLIDFGQEESEPLMQVSGGIIGGNSGGAVYNADGFLVGVPVLGNRTNETLGFAAPLDTVKAFLTDHGMGSLFAHCAI